MSDGRCLQAHIVGRRRTVERASHAGLKGYRSTACRTWLALLHFHVRPPCVVDRWVLCAVAHLCREHTVEAVHQSTTRSLLRQWAALMRAPAVDQEAASRR